MIFFFSSKNFFLSSTNTTSTIVCTVYVLALSGGKVYVGSTQRELEARIRDHFENKGSAWTRRHRPLRVLRKIETSAESLLAVESRTTAELMLELGANNVRGAQYCEVKPFDADSVHGLTAFIGHNLSLGYEQVRKRLNSDRSLVPGPAAKRKREDEVSDHCLRCGRAGHGIETCYAKTAIGCARCGRANHTEDSCFAKTTVQGEVIEEEEDSYYESYDEESYDSYEDET